MPDTKIDVAEVEKAADLMYKEEVERGCIDAIYNAKRDVRNYRRSLARSRKHLDSVLKEVEENPEAYHDRHRDSKLR